MDQDEDYGTEDGESCAEARHEDAVKVGCVHALISDEPGKSCGLLGVRVGQPAGIQLTPECLTY